MDDDWGYPYDLGNLHIAYCLLAEHSTILCGLSHPVTMFTQFGVLVPERSIHGVS